MEIHSGVPDEALFRRLMELQEINKPWQTPERLEAIGKEISHIVFEQIFRYSQTHQTGVHNEQT